ncbi:hypothetical protein AURDEDRAFT_173790 [Auricularia subglabra TFB-10046 SS5]|nr:hypothetical protein AURDEDRAFT_173790 [Auricularia subglabra TFB-10046 SS5]
MASETESVHSLYDEYVVPLHEVEMHTVAFLDAVADPLNPTCCPWCFNLFIAAIMNNPEALFALKRHAHDLWITCINLIVLYAENDVPRLRRRLTENQRNCSERSESHKYRFAGGLTDSFDIFIDGMLEFVRVGMTAGQNPVFSDARDEQSFHRRNGIWPKDLKALFPLGVGKTVEALVHWCCVPMSLSPIMLFEIYLMTARPVIMPKLLESPCRERLVWACLQGLTPGPSVPWSGPPPFTRPRGLAVPLALRRDGEMVETAVSILNAIRADFGAKTSDATRFLAGYESLVLSALERLAPVTGPTKEAVVSYKCLLRTTLGRDNDECPGGLLPRSHAVHDFLERCMANRACAAPGCDEAELSETHGVRRFLSCELCRIVRYCSKACQRADWKHGAPRHKDVCPLMTSLRQRRVIIGAGHEAFDEDLAERGYDPKDIDILYEWAFASELLPASSHGPKIGIQSMDSALKA